MKLDEELEIFDVPIDFMGSNYMHTIRCGDPKKEPLVLLHGYGGSMILYYKMLKDLSKKFHIYCFDFLGLALSSKPEVEFITTEETINFFLGSMEKWFDAIGLKEFYIGGHSLGGYIAVLYALFGQRKVKGMFLFSPAGMTKRTEDDIKFRERVDTFCFLKKKLVKWYLNLWDKNMSIQEIKVKKPKLFGKILARFVKNRMGVKNKDEAEALQNYFSVAFDLPHSAEKCLYTLFHPVGRGKTNFDIEEYVSNYITCRVMFFYGRLDWMTFKGAKVLGKDKDKSNFSYHTVKGSGH